MKLQDILFLCVYGLVLFLRRPIFFVWAGIVCLVIAIPLFAGWIFFTAERLTWYAAGFFLTYIFITLRSNRAK